MFSAYHATNNSVQTPNIHPPLIQMHESNLTNAQLRHHWSVFAEAFIAEAGVVDLPVKSYSLPIFLNFLVSKGGSYPPMLSSNSLLDNRPES